MSRFSETLDRLAATIEERKGASPESSYTAKLLAEGVERAAKKLGEEAVEVVISAVQKDKDGLAAESDDVASWLESREGRSGLEEKAWRHKSET